MKGFQVIYFLEYGVNIIHTPSQRNPFFQLDRWDKFWIV